MLARRKAIWEKITGKACGFVYFYLWHCPLPIAFSAFVHWILCFFFFAYFFFSFQGSLDPPFWGRSSLWSFGEGGFAIDRLFLSLFFTRAFSPLFLRIVLIRCELS